MTAPKPPRKTRAELMKEIDADYYGYRDEDDGRLLPLEREAEENGKQSCLLHAWAWTLLLICYLHVVTDNV